MKLLVISHKEVWQSSASASGYATIGGFPFQMKALSELFDETCIAVPIRNTPPPEGLSALCGHNLNIMPFREPKGNTVTRKFTVLFWLFGYFPLLWKLIREADVVHTPIPGDIGTIGLMLALLQRKRIFIRHCSRWGVPSSLVDRVLQWLLTKIASNTIIVFATGGGSKPPSEDNAHIRWIFATSLKQDEVDNLPHARPWHPNDLLKLITVGSLRPGKNISVIIESLPMIRKRYANISLDILGDGKLLDNLQDLTHHMNCTDIVTFHGNVSHCDVLKLLGNAHIFMFPTFFEGFPKALLEAMAVGLPVIANPVSVIPHLIEINQCGVLLRKPEAESIADSVIRMIADPQGMQTMGENARTAAEKYTLEKWRDQIGEVLESTWGVQLRDQ
jgi:glycosyltransferase involved in cell wall biosynthesis